MFDAQSFLDASVTSSNDTRVTPVPMGEYMGIIESVTPRQWQSKDGTKTGIALDVLWSVEDSGVKELLGRETVTVKQGIMLDLSLSGGIDMSPGKNITLGRLREAVNKNQPGDAFSFAMLAGLAAKISITHRLVNEDTYAEVKGTARL
jgi:hypothetical protein